MQSNSGWVEVVENTIGTSLTVKGNTGAVTDTPNEVEGKSKVQ